MRSTKRALVGGVLLAAALTIGQVSPVAAAELPDIAVASLTAGTYGRGLMTVRYDGTGNVNSLFWQALAGNELRIVGRSIGCRGTPSRSNRVFRVSGMTDDKGTLNLVATRSIDALIKSFWIGPPGEPALCVRSHNYDDVSTTGDWDSDARAGLQKQANGKLRAIALVTRMANSRARISTSVDVVDYLSGPSDGVAIEYRVLFVSGECGARANVVRARMRLSGGAEAQFKSKVVTMTQEQLDTTRSVRIVNAKTGEKFGCVPLSIIMANTEGDFH